MHRLAHLFIRFELFFLALGPLGLFLMSIEDSAGIALVPEILMIGLTLRHPHRMFEYIVITVAGTILGSLILFFIARSLGRHWVEKRMPPERFRSIHAWFEKNELVAVAVPALAPPPVPFKLFVLVAGLFEMPWTHFAAAMAAGRFVRYFLEAWLALRYGTAALAFFGRHPIWIALVIAALFVAAFFVGRWREQRSRVHNSESAPHPESGPHSPTTVGGR